MSACRSRRGEVGAIAFDIVSQLQIQKRRKLSAEPPSAMETQSIERSSEEGQRAPAGPRPLPAAADDAAAHPPRAAGACKFDGACAFPYRRDTRADALMPQCVLVIPPPGAPDVAEARFASIRDAVRHAPRDAVILIGAGQYAGAVHIDKPLTLVAAKKAKFVGRGGASVITIQVGESANELRVEQGAASKRLKSSEGTSSVSQPHTVRIHGLEVMQEAEMDPAVARGSSGAEVSKPVRGAAAADGVLTGGDALATGSPVGKPVQPCRPSSSSGFEVDHDGCRMSVAPGGPNAAQERNDAVQGGPIISTGSRALIRGAKAATGADDSSPSVCVREQTDVAGPGFGKYAIVVTGGCVHLAHCSVRSAVSGCCFVTAASRVTMHSCRFQNAQMHGVLASGRSEVLLRHCQVHGTRAAGVEARGRSAVALHCCRVRKCARSGLFCTAFAELYAEHSNVFGCAFAGVECAGQSSCRLISCRVHDGARGGVLALGRAQLRVDRCEIYANAMANVSLRGASVSSVQDCDIGNGRASGVFVSEESRAELIHNLIHQNGLCGIERCGHRGSLNAESNVIKDNKSVAISLI